MNPLYVLLVFVAATIIVFLLIRWFISPEMEEHSEKCAQLENILKDVTFVDWATVAYDKKSGFHIHVMIDTKHMSMQRLDETVEQCKILCKRTLKGVGKGYEFDWEKSSLRHSAVL